MLLGQLFAQVPSDFIHHFSKDHAVGSGQIDIFENTLAGLCILFFLQKIRGWLCRLDGFSIDNQDLTGFYIPYVLCSYDIKSTGLTCNGISSIYLTKCQRPEAVRVANRYKRVIRQNNKTISPFNLMQGIQNLIDLVLFSTVGNQMQNQFSIRGTLKKHSFISETLYESFCIGQISVVGNSQISIHVVHPEWLNIGRNFCRSGGRITIVPDCRLSYQDIGEDLRFVKDRKYKTEIFVHRHDVLIFSCIKISSYNSGGLLAAMLQGMQTVIG